MTATRTSPDQEHASVEHGRRDSAGPQGRPVSAGLAELLIELQSVGLRVEAKLETVVPGPFRRGAHHWLILHGRYTCKARLPECWRCPVNQLCEYRNKVLEKPVGKGKRASAPSSV